MYHCDVPPHSCVKSNRHNPFMLIHAGCTSWSSHQCWSGSKLVSCPYCRQQYDIPPYSYVKSNRQVPLVLMHADWANFNANPMAPHMVAVGAITAAPAKALPSDLQEFMQSAGEHGVVYASLGTTANPGKPTHQLKFDAYISMAPGMVAVRAIATVQPEPCRGLRTLHAVSRGSGDGVRLPWHHSYPRRSHCWAALHSHDAVRISAHITWLKLGWLRCMQQT